MKGRSIPYIAQAEMADCGAAALAVALGYHGRELRIAHGGTGNGTGAPTVMGRWSYACSRYRPLPNG
ncbi:cysteine peptidase family C39 domain-containing protein [Mycobacterium sp. E2733]|uniref:cysteine peptidase family C39 domain-containing protein n=1 Tax=Mycobacterium sp. E2733 TaxID=1834138 RepID=UPI000A9D7BD2|nr:cysteine peptidase family C39 domain-containing protein [Mycobacterium sp. E2733]